MRMSRDDAKPLLVESHIIISAQRFNSDTNIKHVLSLLPVLLPTKLKLVIGYFTPFMQSYDLMDASDDQQGYVFMDLR